MAPDDDDDSDLDGDGDMSDLDVPDAQRVPSSDAASNVLSPASSAKEEIAEPPITSPFSHADNERPAAVHDPTLLRGPGLSQRPYLQTTSKVLNNCSGTKSLFGGDQSDHICQSKDAEESEGELSISSRQNPEPKETTEQGQEKKREFAIPLFPTSLARLPAEDTPTTPESMLRESNVPCSVSPQVSFTRPTTKSHGSPPWRTSEPKVHRGSLPPGVTEVVYPGRETAPMRKPFHSTNAGWVSWPAEPYSSSQNHHMRPKYKDGLFSEDETAAVPQNCTFYSDGYSANLGPNKPVSRPMHEHEPVESLNPMLLQASQEYRRRELPPPNPHGLFESPYNGEDPLASFLEVFRPAKRKFDEADLYHRAEEERVTQNLRAVEEHMEREIAAEELQQREVISETVKLDSQPTEDRQPTPAPEKSERPRKRARTIKKPHSRARTLAKYAATAAAGAVAGSIGAIVALASLPPNFFD